MPKLFRSTVVAVSGFMCGALLPQAEASARAPAGVGPSVDDYPSIQQAIDQNPARRIFVPAGDHVISEPIRIHGDHGGLWGPGRIVQSNPEAAIIQIDHADDVQLQDLTLTRPAGRMETHRAAVFVNESSDVTLNNVRVLDNRGDLASVYVRSCKGVQIKNCLVQNYSRISIDDRRRRPDEPNFNVVGGYSFHTISGSGIGIRASAAVLIAHNRVIEQVMIPTPELKAKYQLGSFAAKDPEQGTGLSQKMWDEGYNNGWHQGSAIALANVGTDPFEHTNPFVTPDPDPVAAEGMDNDYQVIGNYIENAAQGMDIHVDRVVVAYNIVNNSFMGMKAVHGARNVIIVGNQFSHNDLWAVLLMPGTTSHAAEAGDGAGHPARAANIDGYSIIANNIISDFGYGHARWMWKDSDPTPLVLNSNRALPTVPPLRDVLVEGNMIYDTGRDQVVVDGKPRIEPPRYRYAVKIGTGEGAPEHLRFANNIFNPGTDGVSNVPLPAGDPSQPPLGSDVIPGLPGTAPARQSSTPAHP